MKKFWKILIIVLLVLLVLAGGYVAYVFLDYHRIPDNQTLDVYEQEPQPIAQAGQDYRVLTWNIGFGAYEDDYGFFMDGGTESWAVKCNIQQSIRGLHDKGTKSESETGNNDSFVKLHIRLFQS